MTSQVKSPVTGSYNTVLEREIPCSRLIEAYKKELCIDVAKYFSGIDKVSIYRCLDTGYRFYHPAGISGDGAFYQQLEKFPWYYMDWKWEHSIAMEHIKAGSSVLEIGCAKGSFLEKLRKSGSSVTGLEMNSRAMEECAAKKIDVHPDSIEEFSKNSTKRFDTVCSFQVMEHVHDIQGFIRSSLKSLNPGGTMIISVPNNDSLMIKDNEQILNAPPHHAGLWDMNSLIKLQDYFDIKIKAIHLEPLQEYHLGVFFKMADKKVREKISSKFGAFSPLINRIAPRFTHAAIAAVRESILGHTILIVFKKNL